MEEASELVAAAETSDTEVPEAPAAEADDALGRLERIIESVLFAAASPVSLKRMVDVLAGPTTKEVHGAIVRLRAHYGPGQRGIQLQEVAGGYQFRTARENAEWVRAVFRDKPARLGRAALETLAIVAYKQPATRAEIEAIRGVDVDGVLTTLLSRRLIKIAGRKEAVGRPLLYSTTPEFLEAFGLKDLNDLPSLKELGPAPDGEDGYATSEAAAEQGAAEPPAGEQPPAGYTWGEEPQSEGSAHTAAPVTDGAAPLPDEPGTLAADPAAAAPVGAPAEAAEPSGSGVTAEGGGADPDGPRAAERPSGDPAGDEGGSADGSHHD